MEPRFTSFPFLQAHHYTGKLFSVAGKAWPVSIAAQMVRANIIIRELKLAKLLERDKKIAIVGGGAAGMAAAEAAARLHCKVTLIHNGKDRADLFSRLSGIESRYVYPWLYDWPAAHWSKTIFPRPPRDGEVGKRLYTLSWSAGMASAVRDSIVTGFMSATRARKDPLRVEIVLGLVGTDNATIEQLERGIVRYITPEGRAEEERADVVLLATGPGEERVRCHSSSPFAGPGFWSNDVLGDDALFSGPRKVRLLIVGGGDGALQDYVRVVTGQNDVARLAGLVLNGGSQACRDAAYHIYQVEDELLRRYLTCTDSCDTHRRAHGELEKIIAKLYANDADLQSRLAKGVRPDLRARFDKLHLAFPCDHFSFRYPMNAFVSLLFHHHLLAAHGFETFLPRHGVHPSKDAIVAQDHACDGTCYLRTHKVKLEPKGCRKEERALATGMSATEELEYDVLVLRIGVSDDHAPPVFPRPRQLLPYDLVPST